MSAGTARGTRLPVWARGGAGRAASVLAIAMVPILLAAHALGILASLDGHRSGSILLAVALGIAAADMASGLVHWACDTWGDERTPWLGPGLIRAFREHHRDPQAILAHDWVEVNRETGLAATAALLLLGLPPLQHALAAHPAAWGFLWALLAWGAAANQLHGWAHMERPPRAVRWAARSGLILSGARHLAHHRAPHTRGYCIATGWLNPALDRIGFWRRLEEAVSSITGALPRAHEADERLR